MTYQLGMSATLDASGVASGSALAERELEQLEASARSAASGLDATAAAGARAASGVQVKGAPLAAVAGGAKQAAQATALARHEVQNLSFQLNDIATGLALGQSPLAILAQQGGQLSQVLGNRGLGQLIPAIGQGLRSLVTPTTLALGALAAGAFAAQKAWQALRGEVKSLDDILDEHETAVDNIREAYGKLAEGIGEVAPSPTLLGFDAQAAQAAIAAKLREEVGKFLLAAMVRGGGGPSGRPPVLRAQEGLEIFEDQIFSLNARFRVGEDANIAGFLVDVATAAAAAGEEGVAAAAKLRSMLGPALDLENGLRGGAAGLDTMAEAARLLTGDLDATAESIEGVASIAGALRAQEILQGIGVRRKTDEEKARAAYDEGISSAGSNPRVIQQNENDYQAALNRLAANAEEDRIERANKVTTGLNDENEALKLRIGLVGDDTAASRERLALLRADQAIRADKIGADSEEAEAIRRLYVANAELRAEEKRLNDGRRGNQRGGRRRPPPEERILAGQAEHIERLRLEATLIGTGDAARRRALATLRAEQRIRRAGIDAMSEEAERIRRNALEIAGLTDALAESRSAWEFFRQAGESAIDNIVGAFADGGGDIGAALDAIKSDILRFSLDLAVANPLKNALFDAGLPTLGGGFPGAASSFLSGLLGGGGASAVLPATAPIPTPRPFAAGGFTGNLPRTAVAGLVHGGEFVINAGATARNRRLLETINDNRLPGYASGGFVGPAGGAAAAGPATVVQVIDRAGTRKRTRRTRGAGGEELIQILLERMDGEFADGRYDSQMQERYGVGAVAT